jgi:hypothetical protein
MLYEYVVFGLMRLGCPAGCSLRGFLPGAQPETEYGEYPPKRRLTLTGLHCIVLSKMELLVFDN